MTDPIQFHQHVGADGILSLQVPLGPTAANADVLVTVEPLASSALDEDLDEEDWHAFVESTYGSCAGLGLERQDQGTLEKREPLQ